MTSRPAKLHSHIPMIYFNEGQVDSLGKRLAIFLELYVLKKIPFGIGR